MDLTVRPYQPADRERVRLICHETGLMGESAAWLWRDRESFADMFSGWYTDHESGSAWVATAGDVVYGYLLGCQQTTRMPGGGALLARQILRRGLLLRPGTAGVVWRMITDGLTDLAGRRVDPRQIEFRDPRWPAHLHIDLLPEARGRGAGR